MQESYLQQRYILLAAIVSFLGVFAIAPVAISQTRTTVDVAQALVEAPLSSMAKWHGEEIHYSVSMMGGEAARGMISVGRPAVDDNLGEVVPVQGLVQSVGLLSAMVKFKYAGFSWIDPKESLPLWGDKLLEDSGRSRSYQTIYGSDDYEATITRLENGQERTWTRHTPERVDDIFSWIFRLRSAPLEIGDRYTFYIFDGWLLRRLHVRVVNHVERHEDITRRSTTMTAELALVADAMDGNDALPWANNALLAPVFTNRRVDDVGTMWVSLDERRVPVALEVRTPVGFMRIGLSHHVPPSR